MFLGVKRTMAAMTKKAVMGAFTNWLDKVRIARLHHMKMMAHLRLLRRR